VCGPLALTPCSGNRGLNGFDDCLWQSLFYMGIFIMNVLDGKICLVTGASKGIGLAISKTLASEGAFVVLCARSVDKLEAACGEIVEQGGKCAFAFVDMSDESSIQSLVAKISAEYGCIDILVNNAGVTHSDLLENTRTADWDRCIRVNATGPFILCREALGLVRSAERGFIINVGSVVSIKGYPSQCAYTASKHALRGMTLSLAEDVNGTHVSAHMICPGGVDTDMVGDVRPDINKDELIFPQEIADIVLFIVTRKGRGIMDEFRIRRGTSGPWFS
jgi:NAD(P)-dependent dehydrogenase (short-subunit alcohol dehydrogenase family)